MTKITAPNLLVRLRLAAAFAAIYFIWGSSFLAIRFAIQTIPPFFMAGTRFVFAGAVLYGWARLRGTPRPTRAHWVMACFIGALLLLGGNGALTWSEQQLPSGLAALITAMIPIWMVLLNWAQEDGSRPTLGVSLGIVLGLLGVALLVRPERISRSDSVDSLSSLVLLLGTLSWALGSVYSRRAKLPESSTMVTATQLLAGGGMLLVAGIISGESMHFEITRLSLRSVLSLGYLSVLGSVVSFSAYTWLLRVSTPARVSTYAYVNPVVAIYLGWAFGGEAVTARTLLAAGIIITAVALITRYHGESRP